MPCMTVAGLVNTRTPRRSQSRPGKGFTMVDSTSQVMANEILIEHGLRAIVEAIHFNTSVEISGGGLGGKYGYGADYENDVFAMHPYCWCERADCEWCRACECDYEYEYFGPGGEEITEDEWFWTELKDYSNYGDWFNSMELVGKDECANCALGIEPKPNFLYKPTGAAVYWYKYIGRGMEVDGDVPHDFWSKCIESIKEAK